MGTPHKGYPQVWETVMYLGLGIQGMQRAHPKYQNASAEAFGSLKSLFGIRVWAGLFCEQGRNKRWFVLRTDLAFRISGMACV